MSDIKIHEHSSPIKTPAQLIVVVVLAFVITVALILMLVQMVTGGESKIDPAKKDEAIARNLQPAGRVVVADPNVPKVEMTGKQVVEQVCAACHSTGVLNAPKTGDKAAWAKLIKEGQATITADAIKGIRQMPPRGGNPDLSDTEVARAVAYLANQAGANWKEPDPPAKPVAKVAAAAPGVAQAAAAPAKSGDAGKGKSVYDASCAACHAAGVAGAPKVGDKAAWAPRLKTGTDALYASSIKGKNAMPPKGGNLALADADVKAAVDYMVGQSK